ncbi:MAG: amidase, partial [Candidatus Dormibacteraceae bacterium]
MIDLANPTLTQLHQLLLSRQLSAAELLGQHLAVIQRDDPKIHAFLRVTEELAREQAAEADRRFQLGSAGPLTGIPIGIKDVLSVAGVETTAGSKILQGYRPIHDATCVARLREAGAVFLGMTNCDEFAMGTSNENSAYSPVHNPHDLTRVPGGSSGGSAAAVAAGEAMASLGSDTGGSVRQPAALCGVVGMKPTYGRVSRFGLIAFASSLDQVGPLTHSVEDAAQLLQVIAGYDGRDSTTADRPFDAMTDLELGIKGLRIGIPKE